MHRIFVREGDDRIHRIVAVRRAVEREGGGLIRHHGELAVERDPRALLRAARHDADGGGARRSRLDPDVVRAPLPARISSRRDAAGSRRSFA